MEPLKIPAKYNRCGIKVKCLKCKWQLGDGKCHENKDDLKSISKCCHKEKHRFNLVVCVPNTKNSRRMKILETSDFDEALVELSDFKKELQASGYQKPIEVKMVEVSNTLVELIADYLDFQSGENTPGHLVRIRDKDHISDCKRTLQRFCLSLSDKGYNLQNLEITNIKDIELGHFHDYLIEKHKFPKGSDSYNRHFRIGKAFINWCIKNREINMFNPFTKVELNKTNRVKNKEILDEIEFHNLLQVVTEENGLDQNPIRKRQNVYFPWLKTAFRLGLETGLRNDEIIRIKWSDLAKIDSKLNAFEINDFKVNRKQFGTEYGPNKKIVPITASFMDLLVELGFEDKVGLDETILNVPEYTNIVTIEKAISRAFTHYIKQVSNRFLQFKNLRKTFISHLVMLLGDKAKIFTGHSDDEVMMRHYISEAFIAGGLKDFRVF
jgi:integrase